jgi:hypothetical protein
VGCLEGESETGHVLAAGGEAQKSRASWGWVGVGAREAVADPG